MIRLNGERVALLMLLCALVAIISCKPKEKVISGSFPRMGLEDFDRFYDRFHSDSMFQLSRVMFPLEGYRADGFGVERWKKETWPLMKVKVYDVDTAVYRVSYRKTENEFYEKVWLEESGFCFESRFRLIRKRWYLVYLKDLNL